MYIFHIWILFLLNISFVASLYNSKSHVKVQTIHTFDKELKNINRVTFVEFYAPWCGYCKQFAPIYNTFASKVDGYVNVFALDCDNEQNKLLCNNYKIQGFPTIKIFIPQDGSLMTEDYHGERSLNALMNTVNQRLFNYVNIFKGDVQLLLQQNNDTAKCLLFTSKKSPSMIFKALSMEFKDNIIFSLIHQDFKEAVDIFGVTEFPTIILLPGNDKESITYSGNKNFKDISKFLKEHASYDKEKQSKKIKESKDKKEFSLLELTSTEEFIKECLIKKGISIIGISSLASNFDFFNEVAKSYSKFNYYYIDTSKSSINSLLKEFEISLEESEIMLLNGQKGWYVKLIKAATAKDVLESISHVILGNKIEKKKLNKRMIDMALKTKNKEL